MWMCNWFFKDATKIQNGRQKSTPKLFVDAKNLKLEVRNDSNFTITFPTIWRCAGDFFKVLLKFKMAATDQLQFFGGQFFLILTSHSQQHVDVQMIFERCYQNSKWPPDVNSIFFVGAKALKLNVWNYSNFTITFPTIWRCACDFFKVLPKFKMAAMHELHNFLWAQKLKNWSQK